MLLVPQSYHNIGVSELTTVIDQLMPSTILQPFTQMAATEYENNLASVYDKSRARSAYDQRMSAEEVIAQIQGM